MRKLQTVSALGSFVLAMVLYPEVQKKAQVELDSVVGQGRLPVYEDSEKLPYVRAIVQEAHRLKTLVPMSLPYRAIRDVHVCASLKLCTLLSDWRLTV